VNTAAIGNYCLALAALASGGGILAAVAARRLDSARMLGLARTALYVTAGLLTVAAAALMAGILDDDFRLDYVARYSERALPMGFKLAVFWAGQEGSLLLWGWMVAVMAALTAATRRNDPAPRQAPALGILAAVCGFFAILMLYSANPFQLGQFTPPDGKGLNPMLQDWAMIAHPPLLFLGYAGFTVPFALGLGMLIAGHCDRPWIPPVRRWTLAAWSFLTAGIVLGSEWAYVELGWGGYWAWDPVENASLLPWLTGTALLHSLIVQQRTGMLRVWNAALLAATFILCIFGTYLTRSGVVASVHAFPESGIGWFFLGLLALSVVGSAVVIVYRHRMLRSPRRLEKLLSFAGGVLAANVLLVVMTGTIMIGTIWPLLTKPFAGQSQTLGPEFYNAVILPMGIALVVLMGTGPALRFARAPGGLGKRLLIPVILMHVGIVIAAILGGRNVWVIACVAAGVLAVACMVDNLVRLLRRTGRPAGQDGQRPTVARALWANRRRYVGQSVHLGVVMILADVAGSSLYSVEKEWAMHFGQTEQIGRYTLTLETLEEVDEPTYLAGQAKLTLRHPDGETSVLRPQKRKYHKSPQYNSEVAIHTGLREDVYLALTGWAGRGRITHIQARIKPLVLWIWIGGAVMVFGGLLCAMMRCGRGAAKGQEQTGESS